MIKGEFLAKHVQETRGIIFTGGEEGRVRVNEFLDKYLPKGSFKTCIKGLELEIKPDLYINTEGKEVFIDHQNKELPTLHIGSMILVSKGNQLKVIRHDNFLEGFANVYEVIDFVSEDEQALVTNTFPEKKENSQKVFSKAYFRRNNSKNHFIYHHSEGLCYSRLEYFSDDTIKVEDVGRSFKQSKEDDSLWIHPHTDKVWFRCFESEDSLREFASRKGEGLIAIKDTSRGGFLK